MLFNTIITSTILLAAQFAPNLAGPVLSDGNVGVTRRTIEVYHEQDDGSLHKELGDAKARKRGALAFAAPAPIPVAAPGQDTVAIQRRDFYNQLTNSVLRTHKENKRAMIAEQAEAKKRDTPWHPSRIWSTSFGHYEWWHQASCYMEDRIKWSYGVVVRTITYPDEDGDRQSNYWSDAWSYWTTKYYPRGQQSCHMYGNPKYDPGTQCVDKIWNPSTNQWISRPSASSTLGWTTNNASYAGHKVRTIYDCLLNRTAVEYDTTVSAFGFKPVQYTLDGFKHYRFYDGNNFAWFVACPSNWPGAWKRDTDELGGNNLKKRCNKCGGINPVWDFLAPRDRNPLADTTDIHNYEDELTPSFTEEYRYAITYWPPYNLRNVTVDGHKCVQAALSRPGLRHWTARFFDTPVLGHIDYDAEYIPTATDYI